CFDVMTSASIYTLSLHDALPIYPVVEGAIEYSCGITGSDVIPEDVKISMFVNPNMNVPEEVEANSEFTVTDVSADISIQLTGTIDRKSTRLNSSHVSISYAVFCF